MGLPLDGVRVIEVGQALAGPLAGVILADMGAEVIKIEKPDGGDDARRMGPAFRGLDSMQFVEMNRNKRSVVLDLKTSAGLEQLETLLGTADVLVHNLRPGIPKSLKLDAASVCERHPRLIYCEISGFGDRGPLKDLGGFEPVAQAFSGLISVNGHPGAPPARVGTSVVDLGTAVWCAMGVIGALYRRERTGRGGSVTASLLETALAFVSPHIAAYANQGREPTRLGTGNPMLVPYQAFAASDGDILIAAGNDRLFEKLARTLGHPEWPQDARFASNRARLQHRAELIPLIGAEVVRETKSHWFTVLTRVGVPCAPVNTIPEAVADPHIQALEILQKLPGTSAIASGVPLRFDGHRPPFRIAAPELGQDNSIVTDPPRVEEPR